ncbi:MAG: hypothetical protein JWP97_174 [Labilithrix sp.]|nr:hypothetical protein [Labilithrix sp.]
MPGKFSFVARGLRIGSKRAKNAAMSMPRRVISLLVVALAPAVACGNASPPAEAPAAPSAGTSGASAAAPPTSGGGAAGTAAALATLTAGEAKSGTCDPGHQAALEKLLAEVEEGMKGRTGEDGKPLGLQVVGKRTVALGSAARATEVAVSGKGTELHVLAFGANEVSLDVLVGTTAATTMRSPFQRSATPKPPSLDIPRVGTVTDVQSDSRVVRIKPGQPVVVKLSGQGCAALVSFLEP